MDRAPTRTRAVSGAPFDALDHEPGKDEFKLNPVRGDLDTCGDCHGLPSPPHRYRPLLAAAGSS
jgi:hypothetical protein